MKSSPSAYKASLHLTISLSLFITFCAPSTLMADEFFVSKSGNDNLNNGLSIKKSFLTIQRASNVATSGDTISVMAGTYREQVDIKSEKVVFRPYRNDQVIVNGTELMLAWERVSGSTYKTIMNWDLNEKWGSNQIFSDGKMLQLARWPNQTSADIVMPTNARADSVSAQGNYITIYDTDFKQPNGLWKGATIWINLARAGHDGLGWTGTVISHSKNAIIVDFKQIPYLGNQPWGMGTETEYFLFNPTAVGVAAGGGVDALLSNGEWWKDGNTLYVKCIDSGMPSTYSNGSNLIEAKRRYFGFWSTDIKSGYTVRGFELFSCTITTDPNAINNRSVCEDAHDILIYGLTVRYPSHITNMTGISFDANYTWSGIAVNGRDNTIKNCDIRYSAASAISIQGVNIKVIGNTLASTNYMCSIAGSLNTGFTCQDSEIAYNKIFNTTVMGINFKYSQNSDPNFPDKFRIHHNEIFNFMRRSGDSGAIDMVGADLQWMRIDHNLIYNTLDDAKFGMLKHGIYLDFGSNGENIRATVDHNIIFDVTTPLLLNDGREVRAFNNVLLSHGIGENSQYAVGNFNGKSGDGIKIYNNIMSGPPNLVGCCGDFSNSDLRNNIMNATGAILDELFVNAKNHDYRLKETALIAIDKGISVGKYDENVKGIADIGATEWGTKMLKPDLAAPTIPMDMQFADISSKSFILSWKPSSDNLGVSSYNVYLNGLLYINTPDAKLTVKNMIPSTTYSIAIDALDASGNRSGRSKSFKVKTLLSDAQVIKALSDKPVVDGLKDKIWENGTTNPVGKMIKGLSDSTEFRGRWTSLWDEENLYFYIEVDDKTRTSNASSTWFENDRIEIYIDAEGKGGKTYGARDYQYYIRPGEMSLSEVKHNAILGTKAVTSNTENGYFMEAKIPFSTLGITPVDLTTLGFDILIADERNKQQHRRSWYSGSNRAYSNPSVLGTIQLKITGAQDTKRPKTPKNLLAFGRNFNGFELRWTPSTDNVAIKSYEVFINDTLCTVIDRNTIVLNNLPAQKNYKVKIRAKDASGNLSKFSKRLSVSTRGIEYFRTFEAEKGIVVGPAEIAHNNQTGYSGSGYVTGFSKAGASVTIFADLEIEGVYDVILRYAKGGLDDRKLVIKVNENQKLHSSLPPTTGNNYWGLKSERLELKSGLNKITYTYFDTISEGINIDGIIIYPSSK